VAGHIELLPGERLTVWSILDAMLFDQKRFVAIGKAATANLFMRRALFERHHGFDASLASGGDWEFVERCLSGGARLAYMEAAVVEHPARSRAIPFLKRRWRIERAFGARCRRAGDSLLRFNRGREPVAARRWGFAVGYDTRRLAALGVGDRGRMWLASLPVRYAIIPAVDALAQATGYVRGA
jgi:GT2 family glycosyltransferase